MSKTIVMSERVIREKWWLFFASSIILLVCFVFFAQKGAFAQESDETVVKKFNISFPIAELGNCSSINECKSYCSDEANKETCMSFAKKKGFYKEDNEGKGNARSRALLEKAKSELGCSSEDECRQVCHEEANRDKCMAFAKKYNIDTHSQNPGNKEILEKAKSILGCDSPESCKAVCEQEANRDKCSSFAKSAGLKGGMERVGPGGCKSEEECKAFCSSPDNFEKCQKFGGGQGGQFHGPGGCNSKESCEQFCKENEDKCQGFKEQFEDRRELEKKCQENPEECLKRKEGMGGQNMNREDFCREHPDKCKEFAPNSDKAFEHADEKARFCRENPEKCGEANIGTFEPPDRREFERQGQRPDEFQKPPEQTNSGPGSFNPDTSQTSGSSGSGGDSGGTGSEVQGVSTNPSLLQQIWDFIFN